MSKVDIKNISGEVLKFVDFRGGEEGAGMAIDEVIFIAQDAQLGSEITAIIKESKLNSFSVYIYEGKIQVLENDSPIADVEQAATLFKNEMALAENFASIPILRANSLVTQPVDQTAEGTVILFERLLEARGITVDTSTGELISEQAGSYSYDISLNLDVVKGFSSIVESWFEYFDGSAWQFYPNSGKKKDFDKQSEGYVNYHGTLNLLAGVKFRLKIRSTGAGCQLLSETLQNGIGVVSTAITVHG